MQSDLPHSLLQKRKNTGKGAPEKAPIRASDPAFALQQKAYEKAVARRKAQEEGKEPYELEELFRMK